MILDAVPVGSIENRCFPVAAYPSGISSPGLGHSIFFLGPLFISGFRSFSSPGLRSSSSSPEKFDLTPVSLLIIANLDEFDSIIAMIEHMDMCLSVDYKYNIHFSGFRECAKWNRVAGFTESRSRKNRIDSRLRRKSYILPSSTRVSPQSSNRLDSQSCTRTEILFRGRGVGLRYWRMRADQARWPPFIRNLDVC